MNKRIRELVEQATDEAGLDPNLFAQLIAQECIDVGWQAFLNDNGIVPTFPAQAMRHHFDIEVQS